MDGVNIEAGCRCASFGFRVQALSPAGRNHVAEGDVALHAPPLGFEPHTERIHHSNLIAPHLATVARRYLRGTHTRRHSRNSQTYGPLKTVAAQWNARRHPALGSLLKRVSQVRILPGHHRVSAVERPFGRLHSPATGPEAPGPEPPGRRPCPSGDRRCPGSASPSRARATRTPS